MSAEEMRKTVDEVHRRIAAAAARTGRRAEEITLIGVSKTHPAEAIREAFTAGIRHFGENRVQEWEEKRGKLEDLDGHWHLVGHLQSNKAARAARTFHSIDSVDDFALAERLNRARAEAPSPSGRWEAVLFSRSYTSVARNCPPVSHVSILSAVQTGLDPQANVFSAAINDGVDLEWIWNGNRMAYCEYDIIHVAC